MVVLATALSPGLGRGVAGGAGKVARETEESGATRTSSAVDAILAAAPTARNRPAPSA